MCDKFLKSEKQFFEYKCISDKSWLEKMLHKDFTECGKSGYIMTRAEVIKSLLKCECDRDIAVYNFESRLISDNTAIIHYYTVSDNKFVYRTSIWVKTNTWQLYFHQASVINHEQAEKIKFKQY